VIPAALEMMDRNILVAVQAAFGLEVPAGTEAMLLVECDGSPAAAQAEIEEVYAICQRFGAIELKLAANEAERKHLWTARNASTCGRPARRAWGRWGGWRPRW